jgi:hypothetical protein
MSTFSDADADPYADPDADAYAGPDADADTGAEAGGEQGARPSRAARLLPALWRWSRGRLESGGTRDTAQFLFARILLLPALALSVLALSGAAYFDVHDRTQQLRDRYSPALIDLAHARTSLELAHTEATRRLGSDDEGKQLPQTDLVGLGEKYPALMTEVSQSLNRAAQTAAFRKSQEQDLHVVSGLVVSYGDWIGWADRHHESRQLRESGLAYAKSLLRDNVPHQRPTAVLNRIDELEKQLRLDMAHLSGWGVLSVAMEATALLAALVLAFALIGTLDFIRRKLSLRSLVLTFCVTPVLLALLVLSFGGITEHSAQQRVGGTITDLTRVKADAASDSTIEMLSGRLSADLERSRPGTWALAGALALAVGTAGALACGVTLFHYGRRHLEIHWRSYP